MFTTRTLAVVLVLWTALAARVEAQAACHAPDIRERIDRERPLRATVAALAATYELDGYEGNYEGLYGTFAYNAPWWGAELYLPVYRLDRRQGVEYGLGDLMVTLRGTFYRARNGDLQLGVELPVMLPTGDQSRDLGMGHVMPMPDVYFALHVHPLVLRAQVGYGFAIGDMEMQHGGAHAGHGGAPMKMRSPIVNPMNQSELEHALLVGLGLRRDISVHARWWGAVPIHDDMGVLRQAVALGATATLDWFDLTFELQRTITGAAFEWKPLLVAGFLF